MDSLKGEPGTSTLASLPTRRISSYWKIIFCCTLAYSAVIVVFLLGTKSERWKEIKILLKSEQHSSILAEDSVQRKRHTQLKYACDQSQFDERHQPHEEEWNMHMPRINLFICQNAKAGSTLWREYLAKKYGGYACKRHNVSLEHSEILKVTAVRHPFYRLFSCYNDKIVKIKGPLELCRNQTPFFQNMTFEDFVKFSINEVRNRPYKMDIHHMPYFIRCSPCSVHYDVIVKLETIKSDTDLVISTLNAKGYNVTVDKDSLNSLFIKDKCREFVRSNRLCSNPDLTIPGNIKGLHNQGFSEKDGFTYKNFKAVPAAQRKNMCIKLVTRAMQDPMNKRKIRKKAKEIAKQAFMRLPRQLLEELYNTYKLDFQMFGYDIDELKFNKLS